MRREQGVDGSTFIGGPERAPLIDWTYYQPAVLGGSLGTNPSRAGLYRIDGKQMDFEIRMDLGVGPFVIDGTLLIGWPPGITVLTLSAFASRIDVDFFDSGNNLYSKHKAVVYSNGIAFFIVGTNGYVTNLTATTPFTWSQGDAIYACGSVRIQ